MGWCCLCLVTVLDVYHHHHSFFKTKPHLILYSIWTTGYRLNSGTYLQRENIQKVGLPPFSKNGFWSYQPWTSWCLIMPYPMFDSICDDKSEFLFLLYHGKTWGGTCHLVLRQDAWGRNVKFCQMSSGDLLWPHLGYLCSRFRCFQRHLWHAFYSPNDGEIFNGCVVFPLVSI